MTYWQMALRNGSQGDDMWPYCRERGIAAIGYYSYGQPVVEDCRQLSVEEYEKIWAKKLPKNHTAKASLRRLAYEMKQEDIIYVRDGISKVVGKGRITSSYEYDEGNLKGTPIEWEHFVKVEWEDDFPILKINLHAPQVTVYKLEVEQLNEILAAENQGRKEHVRLTKMEAEEGEIFIAEAEFRKRNAVLIAQKKRLSDYRCEVCKMMFQETYGDIGKAHIIAHHLNPIGQRKQPSMTTLDDIALVCSNCHDMLHKETPLVTLEKLRKLLEKKK